MYNLSTSALEGRVDPAAVKAANDKNHATALAYFQYKDKADELFKEYVAATGSKPVRPKGSTAVITEEQRTIIVNAVKVAVAKESVNLTGFGNVVNKALAKQDIDTKNPVEIKAIAEQLEREGVIAAVWPTKRLQSAVISLPVPAEEAPESEPAVQPKAKGGK